MKNILIFGGLGFIGSNIIETLIDEKQLYTIIVFDFHGMINHFGDKVNVVYGDFNNENDVESVLKNNKIDIVIHLISTTIPVTSNDNIPYDIEANLITSVRMLNLLVKYKINEIVFMSSGGTVYGITESELVDEQHKTNPISSHGIIKLSIEKYIQLFHKMYGINYLILRAGNTYGAHQKSENQGIINVFLRRIIRNQKLVIRGDGSSVRDYFHVKDLALVVKKLIDSGVKNEVINIGSGQGASITRILEIMQKIKPALEVEYVEALNSEIPKIVLDITKLNSLIRINFCSLEEGILKTYQNMLTENQ
jgi:UDP-glucose 4-epimerase